MAVAQALGEGPLANEVSAEFDKRIEALAAHQIDFSSDFLKWPHHAALPESAAARKKLADFLRLADPQVVMLSTDDPALRGQDIDEVRDFIRRILPTATIKITGRDGSIKVLSDLLIRAFGGNADAAWAEWPIAA